MTTGNLRHNSQRSNDSANPVPIRGPLVRIPPERQEGGRRKRSDWRHSSTGLPGRQPAAEAAVISQRKGGGKERLTAMMSGSHQGRTSLPRKMEPTESINLPTCVSIPQLSLLFLTLFWGFPRGGLIRRRAVCVLYGVFGVREPMRG